MSSLYYINDNIKDDNCWMNAKDGNNNQIEKYSLYYNDSAKEEKQTGSLPAIVTDHINLRGRPGYGLTDDYLVDTYSMLRNNQDSLTRDRCPIQLETRIFQAAPKLRGQGGNIDRELDVLSGSDSRTLPYGNNLTKDITIKAECNKSLMEVSTNNFIPLLDNIKAVQNPDNIIMTQVRGGEDTRSYVNKVKFNRCNKNLR